MPGSRAAQDPAGWVERVGRVSVDAQARTVQTRDARVPSAEGLDAQGAHHGARCFKCPKERRGSEPGWYFTDVQDRRGGALGWLRVYVCPRHYALFADPERPRWMPVVEMPAGIPMVEPPPLPVLSGPEELIDALSRRGLSGWVYLVKDVAEGRVRRIHLRQLPADPEIRQALMSYLQSAGTHITLGPGLLRRPHRDAAGDGRGETTSG